MALKALKKTAKPDENIINQFISRGGTVPVDEPIEGDHRLMLRIPMWLLAKIDVKRKERIGTVSRNFWILELIEKEIKKG